VLGRYEQSVSRNEEARADHPDSVFVVTNDGEHSQIGLGWGTFPGGHTIITVASFTEEIRESRALNVDHGKL
jgi:hypothetical protein